MNKPQQVLLTDGVISYCVNVYAFAVASSGQLSTSGSDGLHVRISDKVCKMVI